MIRSDPLWIFYGVRFLLQNPITLSYYKRMGLQNLSLILLFLLAAGD